MKLLKKGFSLAELLLVIGIISIVTAMGANITKKTTQKAYDLYYYTGYVNLYNTICEATQKGKAGVGAAGAPEAWPLTIYVNRVLGTTDNPQVEVVGGLVARRANVIARNGIIYSFSRDLVTRTTRIIMRVPSPKTRANNTGYMTVTLIYNSGNNYFLVPISAASNTTTDLLNRRDLLPTYIDNGINGRVRSDLGGANSQYAGRNYYSYREAYCRNTNNADYTINNAIGNAVTYINCAGVTLPAGGREVGVLKFADPRYAK